MSEPEARLKTLRIRLIDSGMTGVLPFHDVYTIVTREVVTAAEAGTFLNKGMVLREVSRFIDYYDSALETHLRGIAPPPAWATLFDRARSAKGSRMRLLALGVNAHVRNDLPQALRDLEVGQSDYPDFRSIGRLIGRNTAQIIEAARISLGPFNPVVGAGMIVILTYWRRRAWQDAGALAGGRRTTAQIEASASRSARLLRLAPWPR